MWSSPWSTPVRRRAKVAAAIGLAAGSVAAYAITGRPVALALAAAFLVVVGTELHSGQTRWLSLTAEWTIAATFIAAGVPEAAVIAIRSVALRTIQSIPARYRPAGAFAATAGIFAVFAVGSLDALSLVGFAFVLVFTYGGYLALDSQSQSLEFHEQEHDAFFRQAPMPMYRTSPNGAVLDVNEAMARFMGLERVEDLIGGPGRADRRYADVAERHEWQRLMESRGQVLNYETRMKTFDGTVVTVLDSARAIRAPDGTIRFYEGVLTDISDLRAAEAQRERLARIIDATSDMVAVLDGSGNVLYRNQAAANWFKRYVSDEPFVALQQLFSIGQLVAIEEHLSTGGTWAGELVVEGEERRYMNAVGLRFESPEGLYFAAIGRDLSDEISTAAQLESLIASKDEFIAAVSHELRTPLTTVVGLSAELRDNAGSIGSEEAAELIRLIADQSMEVADIVEDLLVAARKDTDSIILTAYPCPVGELVARTVDSLPDLGSSTIAVDVGGSVLGDPQRIRQVLRNLLTNAMRYGGDRIHVETVEDGPLLHIDVHDDGDGIPPEMRDIVFEAFERAHEPGTQPGSVGLGLSVSRWLATKMGGDLQHLDVPSGCTFRLTLPVPPADVLRLSASVGKSHPTVETAT